MPAPPAGDGMIAGLSLDDPQAFLSELSDAERSCLEEKIAPEQTLAMLDTASADAIGCLADDTLMRLFLTSFTSDAGPLSVETSDCIRAGFDHFDLRGVMLAGPSGSGEEAAMQSSMGAFFLALSCLNDAEWQASGPVLGMSGDDRAGLQCLAEALGGPAELAAALQSGEGQPPVAFINAAAECSAPFMMPPASSETPGPTAAPEPAPGSGMIAPLPADNPLALFNQLSDAERSCLAETGDLPQLGALLTAPETVAPETAVAALNCLSDDTLLRLFLGGMVGGLGPLSAETSGCIRAGFDGYDIRSVMLAGYMGDPGAAMMGSMGGLFLTVSCLNDEEWQVAGPALGMSGDDRAELQCLTGALGGPAELAAALQPDASGMPTAYIAAAAECGLETGMGMMPPAPGSGMIAPLPADNPLALFNQLSDAERSCLAETGDLPQLGALLTAPETVAPETAVAALNCLSDDTLLRLFLGGMVGGLGPLSAETSGCIRAGFDGYDIRSVMLAGYMGDPGAAMMGSMGGLFLTVSCLNDEEWQVAGPALGMSGDDRAELQCLTGALGGPAELAAALQPDASGMPTAYIAAAAECGLETGMGMMPPAPGSGMIAPLPADNPLALFNQLSDAERSCLAETGDLPQLGALLTAPETVAPETAVAALNCLSDDTLLRLFLGGMVGGLGPLSAETSGCIRAGFDGYDIRSVMLAGYMGDPGAAMMGSMGGLFLTVSCLNDEEWQVAGPALGMSGDDRAELQCLTGALGGPAELAAALQPDASGMPTAFIAAAAECGLEMTESPGG